MNEELFEQITNFMENIIKKWSIESPTEIVNKANFGNLYLLDDLRYRIDGIEIDNQNFPKICKAIKDYQFPESVIDFADDCEEYPFINDCYDINDFLNDLENWL